MRLRDLSFRGVTRFTSATPVSIDFEALGEGLVALVGVNGAGKSSILEAAIGCLYRVFPSRPGWYEYFHGRDAYIETRWTDGDRKITVRTQVDADRRTTEQYIWVNDVAVTTGRAAEAEKFVEENFGSLDLVLASVVSAQNRAGNFLLMPKGGRKGLFTELLNLGHLDVLHEKAKERHSGAEWSLTQAREAMGQGEAEIRDLGGAESKDKESQVRAELAAGRLETARQEETAATAAVERAKTQSARVGTLETAVRTAERGLGDAREFLRTAVDVEPKARQTAERSRKALEAQKTPDTLIKTAEYRHAAVCKSIDARREQLEKVLGERKDLEDAADQVVNLEAELATLEQADRARAGAEAEQRIADQALGAANKRVEDATSRLEDEKARLATEAQLLSRVPCTSTSDWLDVNLEPDASVPVDLASTCPLLKAAQDAKARGPKLKVNEMLTIAVNRSQERFDAAVEAVGVATLACDPVRFMEVREQLPVLRSKAARLIALDRAAKDLAALKDELDQANTLKSDDIKVAEAERARQETERKAIERDLKAALEQARAGVTDAQGRLDRASAAVTAAKQDLAKAQEKGALTVPQAEANLSKATTDRYAFEQQLRDADREHAAAGARLEQLRARAAEIPALQADVRAGEEEVGALALLVQALGKDGIQALELDAAAPEVALLTNALLEVLPTFTRFRISFETLRAKKSGKGDVESFDVRVFDNGQDRPVEALSGGERVIVGEAIGLAIAILNARKNNIRWTTIIRDETAGALDPVNASAYVDLLRRALALGGFDQVLFVAHQREVTERADVRLVVADGHVTLDGAAVGAVREGAAA